MFFEFLCLPVTPPPAGDFRTNMLSGPGEDLRARAFDGRELELNVSAAPMRGPDGRVVGAVMDARDLTEHNQMEREREAAYTREQAAHEASQQKTKGGFEARPQSPYFSGFLRSRRWDSNPLPAVYEVAWLRSRPFTYIRKPL
jgi:hypothetical protein